MSLIPDVASFVDLLRFRVDADAERPYARFLREGEVDGAVEPLSYGGLDRAARAIAARLQASGAAGERVLLLYPPGLRFVEGFFGCLYAGAIAVPAFPPDPRLESSVPRLVAIAEDAGARFALTTSAVRSIADTLAARAPALARLEWIATDTLPDATLPDGGDAWRPPALGHDSVAFLQYTSGSTGDPKGVVVSHGNLLDNSRAIARGFDHGPDLKGVIWLPPYHDMGLIGGVLQPVAVGGEVTLLSPFDFLRRPVRWLQAIARHRATTSGGPDFAYRLCVDKVTDAELSTLDLSSWKVAFSGAEPVRVDTLRAFADRFAAAGFRAEAFYPTYGLAEATLMSSGGPALRPLVTVQVSAGGLGRRRVEPPGADDVRTLVSSGPPLSPAGAVIVDPELRLPIEPGGIGEIWLGGASVCLGYWNRPALTEAVFGARLEGPSSASGPWLRTGDLGFVHDGELFVTGRIKDLVILRGRNVYPQDVEAAASAAHASLGAIAAFGIDGADGEELAIVAEVDESRGAVDRPAVIAAIRDAVGRALTLSPSTVVLVGRGRLPKTSSGKIQRFACRDALANGGFDLLARSDATERPGPEGARGGAAGDAKQLADRIAAVVARYAGQAADTLDRGAPFYALGIDSVKLIDLTVALEEALGRTVPTMALFDHPTVDALAAHLAADGEVGGTAAEGETTGVYVDLGATRARLDERGTNYQFDIDADVAWDQIDAPGEYMSSGLLADLGVDVETLRGHPEAWALFQWAMGLQVCATFELLELGILFFAHRERAVLGTSTSVALLCAEEEKHIQLFRRYARHLRAQRPTDAARLDVLAEDTYAYIRTGLDARTLPSPAAVHFLSWLRILFFEEYTVHLHKRLSASDAKGAPVQPAWATAHAAHAREEVQHIVTDMAHLRAIDLSVDDRRALSALFAHDMLHDFERQFAVEGARRLVEERFPGLVVMRQEPGLAASCLRDLVRERVFAQARSVAPFLAELGDLPSTAAPRAAREAAGALLGDAAALAGGVQRGEPIAIVGLGCRVPGGVVDAEGLWDLLMRGADAITEVPPSRWDVETYFDADPRAPGRMYTRWGGFLDGIEQFDPSFFGIAPREARSMDPQQRLLLETAWEALEDAGIPPERLAGSKTGVYLGLCSSDYSHRETVDAIDGWTVTGNAWSIAAGRLSYVLGLHGPCLAVDTACSSGLVALHLAIQSLRSGESEAALVGAANLILVPQSTICFSALRAMSPVGRCKTFDASADGYVRSEAVAMFLLKPLSAAQRDGDRIHAVIRGSAVNQDGRSNGLTAPNGTAQQAVIRAALDDAGLTPADIGYVEAHGTGTGLGDPIELAALGEVMRTGHPRSRPVPIGSVKTNVGHSEGVSGLVGLLKAVLVLQNATIPPHLHMREPTPRVDWARMALRVPTTMERWAAVGVPRVAGVSSFGFGGTNAHAIVEEAPAVPNGAVDGGSGAGGPVVVPISGATEEALRQGARALAAHLTAHPEVALADVAYTTAVGRTHHRWRATPVAADATSLFAELTAIAEGQGGREVGDPPRVALLFTGQGAQYAAMGRPLYERFPAFRESIDRSIAAFPAVPLRALLLDLPLGEGGDGRIDRTANTQPALFAFELAVAELWRALGVEPVVLLGHSVGEIAAACFAGALTLADAARLVTARGALMEALPEGGAMVSAATDEATAATAIAGRVSIAAVNARDQVVLSGDADAIDAIVAHFQARGVPVTRLVVSHAFHSARLEPMLADLDAVAAGLDARAPRIPLVANLDGRLHPDAPIPASYWARHAREAVRFADGLRTVLDLGVDALVEVGPQPILLGLAARVATPDGVEGPMRVGSARRGRGPAPLLDGIGRLHALGAPVAWAEVFRGQYARRIRLPTYRFQRQRHWLEEATKLAAGGAGAVHPLVGARIDVAGRDVFEVMLSTEAMPLLADHRVGGRVVVPATAYLEMMRAAWLHGPGGAGGAGGARGALATGELYDVRIEQPLVLADGERRRVQCSVESNADGVRVDVFARTAGADGRWVRHASGRVRGLGAEPAAVDVTALEARCAAPLDADTAYAGFAAVGLGYGPAFRGLLGARRGDGEAIARIALPLVPTSGAGLAWHPALLDAALQATASLLGRGAGADAGVLYLPVGFARVWGLAELPASVGVHVRLHDRATDAGTGDPAIVRADLALFDPAGNVVLAMEGLELRRASSAAFAPKAAEASGLFAIRWAPVPLPSDQAAMPDAGRWRVIGDGALAEALVARLPGTVSTVLGDTVEDGVDGVFVVAGDGAEDPADAAVASVGAGVRAAQTLLRSRATTRFWIVTRGAQAVDGVERGRVAPSVAAAHASLWGLGRTLTQEHPNLGARLVDCDPSVPVADAVAGLLRELVAPDAEDQVVLRGEQRFAARLVEAIEAVETPIPDAPNDHLDIGERGRLDTLRLSPSTRVGPGPGQVEIEVEASGLNFRDVLNALGMYKGRSGPLGGECAGRVVAVGADVRHLVVGDPVMALASAAFGRFVTTDARLAVKRPRFLTAEEAATVPITFLTAWYGLFQLARLQPGERVLIHAAAGGVGMAAVQLALRAGAEVHGTASHGKWDVLRASGVEHIYDSRSVAFAEEVARAIGGAGIDVVLNALIGGFIPASLKLMRPGGRFLEMGKAELWDAAKVAAVNPDVSYRAFDLVDVEPDVLGRMLGEIAAAFDRGELRPLPRRVFPVTRAVDAFRYMAQARHVGKVVLARSFAGGRPPAFDPDGAWLVTGASGALGRHLCTWLVEHGARHLALVGRVAVPHTDPLIVALRAAGATVETFSADVSDADAVRGVVASLDRPLRGVIHAAGVLDDATVTQQDAGRIARVFGPKAAGAWALHEATRDLPLAAFVLVSSAASVLGSAGQSNYAAANAFLDGLARARRAWGLPATSVAFGPWAEGGMADRLGAREKERLSAMGIGRITPARGLASLAEALRRDVAELAVLPVDLDRLRARLAKGPIPTFYADLAGAAGPATRSVLADTIDGLADALPRRRHPLLVQGLREATALALGLPSIDAVDPRAPLRDLGLDSLMSIDLHNAVSAAVRRPLPESTLLDHPTLDALARHLLEEVLALTPAHGQGVGPVEVDAPVVDALPLDALTLDEASRQLADELRELEDLL